MKDLTLQAWELEALELSTRRPLVGLGRLVRGSTVLNKFAVAMAQKMLEVESQWTPMNVMVTGLRHSTDKLLRMEQRGEDTIEIAEAAFGFQDDLESMLQAILYTNCHSNIPEVIKRELEKFEVRVEHIKNRPKTEGWQV